jgi:hypothetical protein
MNHCLKLRTLVAIAVLALGVKAASAKEISVEKLPAPAKRVVDTEVGSGKLKKVEEVVHNGETIYALTYQRPDGSPKYIFLRANGTYVRDQDAPTIATTPATPTAPGAGASTAANSRQQVQLSQLPQAVQRTIQTETRNGPVTRIDQIASTSGTMYEVFFRQANGQDKTIYLNPDGTYVQAGKPGGSVTGTQSGGHSWDTLGSGATKQPAPR